MAELIKIKDFIQKVAKGITLALDIDTQVIDCNYQRVAGTVYKPLPDNGGVVKRILETGTYEISTEAGCGANCQTCAQRFTCLEKGYVHCPIYFEDKVIGVMGLICFKDSQLEKLKDTNRELLSFVQSMCDLIQLKLNEYNIAQKEQKMYQETEKQNQLLNLVLNQISDGYVLLDEHNRIRNTNQNALNLLEIESEVAIGAEIFAIIPDSEIFSILNGSEKNAYEEIYIKNKKYGVLVSLFFKEGKRIGATINFKTIDNIGRRVTNQIYKNDDIEFEHILGASKKIRDAKYLAGKVAKKDPNILLLGESGTGKELFARAIHNASLRRQNPFVSVNCAAIPLELLESELFGYEGGAFTGAKKGGKIGKFEMANTGTIFLDEIGDMPCQLQAKMLRVLQERKIDKIGGERQISVDIRIIAATNKDLEKMVVAGQFREDLYYRLNVIPIHLPPLRERTEDIPALVDYFIKKYQLLFSTEIQKVDEVVMSCLRQHKWNGNIRELENVIQYMLSVTNDDTNGILGFDSLPPNLRAAYKNGKNTLNSWGVDAKNNREQSLQEVQDELILKKLKQYGTTTKGKKEAAKDLNISLSTLYRRMERIKIV